MKGDFTRNTFKRDKHYSSVRMQQGRVQLDADWNEQLDIEAHRYRTTHRDVIGYCGGPNGDDADGNALAGFEISAAGTNLLISKGRYYVNGILCENEAGVLLTEQEDLPGYDPFAEIAEDPGIYLAYLDVWERHITALEDEEIREVALGGPDTTTRARVVWQVKVERVGDAADAVDCDAFGLDWTPAQAVSTGMLAARSQESAASTNPCIIPPNAGYRRLENQLYRVEIHDAGGVDEATFKWSRENGSIVTPWEDQDGNNLTMSSAGRDRNLGFTAGDWIELTNDDRELNGRPGVLVQLDRVDGQVLTIDPATIQDPDDPGASAVDRAQFLPVPKIRRWESEGAESVTIPATNDGWIELEDGVEIRFQAGGDYKTGDFWTIPARTALGNVLWPQDETSAEPEFQLHHGIEHAYCPLALITWQPDADGILSAEIEDCRYLFPPLTNICAEDVCFDNGRCDLPGAETVQDALDRLCERNDLPHHNKHLHGWGIVCGLQVVCGPDLERPRRHVTVRDGYALDCEGNDVILEADRPIDILEMIRRQSEERDRRLLDENGNGDVCLILRSDPRQPFELEPHDPARESDPLQALLAGTLLMDFYDHCIKRLVDFVREEFTPPEEGQPAGPVEERLAAFTNLIAQPINPTAGQHIFLSLREHRIIHDFYVRLRALLRSETYCAMFDNARPFPDYPEEFLEAGMDTVFGKSFHTRLRLRPRSTEGYTVGEGLNLFGPSTTINRYQLAGDERRLISQIDPLAGSESDTSKNDSGAGAVQDVAFSPDGRRIYVIISSRDEEDTFFRVGELREGAIRWQPLAIICGVKLVTLATTPADPNNVYAVGMKKVIVAGANGQESSEFRGAGLYRITPDEVDPELEPIAEFNASGHLQISEDGRAFATAADEGVPPLRYDRIVAVRVVQGNAPIPSEPILLGAEGSDDIAIRTGNVEVEAIYTVVGPQQGSKRIVAHRIADGRDLRLSVPVADTAIRLEVFRPTEVLLITSADGYNVQLINLNNHQFESDYLLPMQVGPAAIAANQERSSVYVLNTGSNTITTVENREVFRPEYRFELAQLARYRADILNAFTDLLAGLLQYLKDCFCHLLLVNCPECTEDEKLYLACVSVRGGEVERACNFSRRRYVKSFPTVGYWFSMVPIAPVVGWLFEQFCCMVLPNLFGRVATQPTEARYTHEYQPRVSAGGVYQGTSFLRDLDIMGQIRRFTVQGRQAQTVAMDRLRATPSVAAAPPARPARPIVDQPIEVVESNLADRGISVSREPYDPAKVKQLTAVFRTPAPGSEVTLYEENGLVRYYDIRTPEVAAPVVLRNQVEELSQTLEAREAELQTLRTQVETLTRQQSELEARASTAGVAELRAEVEELRQFREEVRRFMSDSRR